MPVSFTVSGHTILVDEQDTHWLGPKSYPSIVRMRSPYQTSPGHVSIYVNGRRRYLHRMIVSTPEGMMTDHIDGNALNNCRNNLRICTRSQNAMNRGPNGDNPHGLKGIRRDKRARLPTWSAKIKRDGKDYHLGSFRTPEEAHAAYCAAAPKIHGEFARTA